MMLRLKGLSQTVHTENILAFTGVNVKYNAEMRGQKPWEQAINNGVIYRDNLENAGILYFDNLENAGILCFNNLENAEIY